ncbi:MAG TPA: hypothetical protein VKY38_08435 [Azoarcus sp.]|nr:hypothetical protein [Azoarcus sp.]
MNPAAGSMAYDATPSLNVPMRFFLTAPLFGMAAGGLLIFSPHALTSRWLPETFAVVHLVAVGFMLMVMSGALFQILPVVAGRAIPGKGVFAGFVHAGLCVGAVLLSWGLGASLREAIEAGALALLIALTAFIGGVAAGLWGCRIDLATQRDLRLAMTGIAVTVMLGTTLALVLSRGAALPFLSLLELHVGWAFLGAAGMLLAATSWIVVPMFQITPPYPAWMMRAWGWAVFISLLAWSLAVMLEAGEVAGLLLSLPLLLAAAYALATLWLQHRSRRTRPDETLRAFRLAMCAFLAGLVCVVMARYAGDARWSVTAGVLVLYGGFVGVIQGMLYKIVPFLCWLHLSQKMRRPPNMKKLQPDGPVRRQARLHALALGALLVAVMLGEGWAGRVAGVLVAADFGCLLWNMTEAMRNHRRAAMDSQKD